MTMASFTANIPKIDLESWLNGSPEQRTRVEKEFRQICHEIGFFYLINHGVENEFLDKHMKVIQVFFDLPLEYKQTIEKSLSPQFRGWEALGSELTNNQVDYREQIDFGPERPPLVFSCLNLLNQVQVLPEYRSAWPVFEIDRFVQVQS